MNLLDEPGFETVPMVAWTIAGQAFQVASEPWNPSTPAPYAGTYSVELKGSTVLWVKLGSDITQGNITVTLGTEYDVEVYVNGDLATSQAALNVYLDDGDGVLSLWKTLTSDQATGGYQKWTVGTFFATGTTVRLSFSVPKPSGSDTSIWYVDNARLALGSSMAIYLAERAVNAVVTTMQASYGTELDQIVTEKGDGISLATPATGQYYKRPKSEIAGATAHVEVYEGGFDFEEAYTDADHNRAVYDVPITVRVTVFNRDGVDADTMMIRCRRYGAALKRLLVENPRLGATDDAIKIATMDRYEPYWETDGGNEDMVRSVRVTAALTVKCEEVTT